MKSFCSYFNEGICSSCSRIETDYLSQLHLKQEKLKALLSTFKGVEFLAPVPSSPTHFRNKAKFTVTGSLDTPVIGLTGEDDLDQGRDIKQCPLHHPRINELIERLPQFIQQAKLHPYLIKQKSGELKGIIAYFSTESGEMYLRFILRSKESLDRIKKHLPSLTSHFPELQVVSGNIQPIPHAILEGEEEVFFTSKEAIAHRLGPVEMSLHPKGFVQTNQEMAKRLYETAAQWIGELQSERFLELFSGQGAFSFFIQKQVREAVGVEINQEAVNRANETAKQNGWKHLRFVAADAAQVDDFFQELKPDIILVNPPRRGLAGAVDLIRESQARHFIYSSCNANTLAQDLEKLQNKFQVVKAQVFDMFPHTEHFETLVLLRSINDG